MKFEKTQYQKHCEVSGKKARQIQETEFIMVGAAWRLGEECQEGIESELETDRKSEGVSF